MAKEEYEEFKMEWNSFTGGEMLNSHVMYMKLRNTLYCSVELIIQYDGRLNHLRVTKQDLNVLWVSN